MEAPMSNPLEKQIRKVLKIGYILLAVILLTVLFLLVLPYWVMMGLRANAMLLMYEYIIALSVMSGCLGAIIFLIARTRKMLKTIEESEI